MLSRGKANRVQAKNTRFSVEQNTPLCPLLQSLFPFQRKFRVWVFFLLWRGKYAAASTVDEHHHWADSKGSLFLIFYSIAPFICICILVDWICNGFSIDGFCMHCSLYVLFVIKLDFSWILGVLHHIYHSFMIMSFVFLLGRVKFILNSWFSI